MLLMSDKKISTKTKLPPQKKIVSLPFTNGISDKN